MPSADVTQAQLSVQSTARAIDTLTGSGAVSSFTDTAQAVIKLVDTSLSLASSGTTVAGLAGSALSSIGGDIAGDAAGIAGDVASIVPVIGALVKVVIDIVKIAIALSPDDTAAESAAFQAWLQTANVRAIDSVDPTPADIFASVYQSSSSSEVFASQFAFDRSEYIGDAAARKWLATRAQIIADNGGQRAPTGENSYRMPAIGFALTMLTESRWNASTGNGDQVGVDYRIRQAQTVRYNQLQAAQGLPQNGGLSIQRTTEYKLLRRAIVDQLGVVGSDEGAQLWLIYLDMLRQDFDSGALSTTFGEILLNQGGWSDPSNAGSMDPPSLYLGDFFGANYKDDFSPLMGQIEAMVDRWRNSQHPSTAKDIAAYASVKQQLDAAIANYHKTTLHFSTTLIAPPMSTGKKVAIASGIVGTLAAAGAGAYYFVPGVKAALRSVLRLRNPGRRRRGKRGSDLDR